MPFKLRPYQEEAVSNIKKDWESGNNKILLSMATGLGKTAVFLSVLHDLLGNDKRALILAHRKELIEQPKEKLLAYYPEWEGKIGIVMAGENDTDKQITIATVQTVSRSPKRLNEIWNYGQIDYLITDEAHHAVAQSYMKVYDMMFARNPELKHLGVTATPYRADHAGLIEVFDKVTGQYGIIEGIQMHYLSPVRWLAIETKIDLSQVKISQGDFAVGQLSEVFCTEENLDLVVQSHKLYAGERQAIAFVPGVSDAYELAAKFNDADIPAAAADGTTPKTERAQILDDFYNGKYQVLCNVGLYTEGLDVPMVSCVHQVRPTKSDGLYTQMVGRALRTYPGKDDALVLDYAPIDDRNIAMMGNILGKRLRKDAVMKKDKERGEVIGGLTFDGTFNWMDGSPVEIISRQLDYLDITKWSWYRSPDKWMSLGLGELDDVERTLIISSPTVGEMKMYLVAKIKSGSPKFLRDESGNRMKEGVKELLTSESFETLKNFSEEYADQFGNSSLAIKSKQWRKQYPSSAQINFAERLRIPVTGQTKGTLAQQITHSLAIRTLKKYYPERIK